MDKERLEGCNWKVKEGDINLDEGLANCGPLGIFTVPPVFVNVFLEPNHAYTFQCCPWLLLVLQW